MTGRLGHGAFVGVGETTVGGGGCTGGSVLATETEGDGGTGGFLDCGYAGEGVEVAVGDGGVLRKEKNKASVRIL